jgi:hypothetical protein
MRPTAIARRLLGDDPELGPYVQQRLVLTERDFIPSPWENGSGRGALFALPCDRGLMLSRAWTEKEDLLGFLGLTEMKRLRSLLEQTIPEVEAQYKRDEEEGVGASPMMQQSFAWTGVAGKLVPKKAKGAKGAP